MNDDLTRIMLRTLRFLMRKSLELAVVFHRIALMFGNLHDALTTEALADAVDEAFKDFEGEMTVNEHG